MDYRLYHLIINIVAVIVTIALALALLSLVCTVFYMLVMMVSKNLVV